MKLTFRLLLPLILTAVLVASSAAQMRSNKLGVGLSGSMYSLSGDASTKTTKFGSGLALSYSPWQLVGFRSLIGIGQFGYTYTPGYPNTTTFVTLNGYVTGNFMPNSSFNPFVSVGAGYIYFDPRTDQGVALTGAGTPRNDFNFFVGGGIDYFFSEFLSATLGAEMALTNTDRLDGVAGGSSKTDSYLRFGLEIRYYFFDKAFLTRMLDAVKSRYE